jgi:multisubunit Na+/H+ antiporter MnhF subunit
MTPLKIAQFVCLFMLAVHAYKHVTRPSHDRLLAANVWAAAFVVLIALMPA